MKQHLQPLISLILSALADVSRITDINSERGQLRDIRFMYLLLSLGATITLNVIGTLLYRAAQTCCAKPTNNVVKPAPFYRSNFESFLAKDPGLDEI